MNIAMTPSEDCYALIKHFEGFADAPYRCPAGYMTVGYGHLIRDMAAFTRTVASPVTQAQAEAWLHEDAALAARAVTRLLPVMLTQGQYDALVSFTFNLGAGALQRSTLRRVILRGDMAQAQKELHRWVYAGGAKLPGLVRRRAAEAALFSAPSRGAAP